MYKKATLTISHFDVEDVITTSGVDQPQPQPGGQNGESENFPV